MLHSPDQIAATAPLIEFHRVVETKGLELVHFMREDIRATDLAGSNHDVVFECENAQQQSCKLRSQIACDMAAFASLFGSVRKVARRTQGTNARNRNAAKSTRCTAPCIT